MYAVVIRLNGIYRHNFDVYYALYRLHAMRIAPCPYVYTYILRFRWFRFRWTRVVLGFSSFESTLFSASDQNRFPPLRLLDVSFRTKPSKSPTTRRRRRFSISIRNQKSVTGDPPPTGALVSALPGQSVAADPLRALDTWRSVPRDDCYALRRKGRNPFKPINGQEGALRFGQ